MLWLWMAKALLWIWRLLRVPEPPPAPLPVAAPFYCPACGGKEGLIRCAEVETDSGKQAMLRYICDRCQASHYTKTVTKGNLNYIHPAESFTIPVRQPAP